MPFIYIRPPSDEVVGALWLAEALALALEGGAYAARASALEIFRQFGDSPKVWEGLFIGEMTFSDAMEARETANEIRRAIK